MGLGPINNIEKFMAISTTWHIDTIHYTVDANSRRQEIPLPWCYNNRPFAKGTHQSPTPEVKSPRTVRRALPYRGSI